MKTSVRVRFAPSPTGLLHIGGMRTALFNYLFAQNQGGKFILRLEDTDRARFDPQSIVQIETSLQWLGLEPDEGYWLGKHRGEVGPYVQSKRLPHYREYAVKLVEQGLAYYSNATLEDINRFRQTAKANKQPFIYKKRLENGLGEIKDRPIRLDTAATAQRFSLKSIDWKDERRGQFSDQVELMEDFIILKADGFPTYNFANVIDDHMMRISHVIRGDEFISSTAKHVLLYRCLGWEEPKFIHLPAILGSNGKKKLSKRDGDVDVLDYQTKGYLPEALLNFLVLLGWNDGGEQEIFNRDQLIQKFDIGRIQKSPAIFDLDRLNWLNGEYLRTLTAEEFTLAAQPFLPKTWQKDHKYLKSVLVLEQERVKRLDELEEMVEFFFVEPKLDIGLLTAQNSQAVIKVWLSSVGQVLDKTNFSHHEVEKALRQLCQQLDCKTGQLFYAIRVALTGRTAAPGLFDTIITLDKKKVIKRLTSAVNSI